MAKSGILRLGWEVTSELFSHATSPLLRGPPSWPSAHQLSASNRLGSGRSYVSPGTHSLNGHEDGAGESSH